MEKFEIFTAWPEKQKRKDLELKCAVKEPLAKEISTGENEPYLIGKTVRKSLKGISEIWRLPLPSQAQRPGSAELFL